MSRGILVGADAKQEWLLSWWWRYYSKHNQWPVTFVDFGMTAQARAWCAQHGAVISLQLPQNFIAQKHQVDPAHALIWERWYGKDMWQWRASCFHKPFAWALSPYSETVWLDLDCEVLSPIEPLFQYLQGDDFAIGDPLQNGEYNSGVVVYRKNSLILKCLLDLCLKENHRFCGDDYALTYLLHQDQLPFALLPLEWNWVTKLGINFFVHIFHWSTEGGKRFIQAHGGIQKFFKH